MLAKKSDRLLFASFGCAAQSVSGLFLFPAITVSPFLAEGVLRIGGCRNFRRDVASAAGTDDRDSPTCQSRTTLPSDSWSANNRGQTPVYLIE